MLEKRKIFSPWTTGLLLVLALLLVKNILAWSQVAGEDDFRLGSMIQDDGYYYLLVAENILDGRGATFDGIHPTTGFQPLYQGLTVLYAGLSRALGVSVFKTIYVVNFLLVIAASLVLFRSLLRLDPRLSRFWLFCGILILFPFNFPLVFKRLACGMEMGLSLFLLSCAFYLLCRWPRTAKEASAFGLTSGLLMGLLGLTRIDYFLFAALFLVALGLGLTREGRSRGIAFYLAGLALPVGIYALIAGLYLDTMVPVSFLAKKQYVAHWKEGTPFVDFFGAFLSGAAKMWIFPVGFTVFGFYVLGGETLLIAAVLLMGIGAGILLCRRAFPGKIRERKWPLPLVWVAGAALLHTLFFAWGGPNFILSAQFWYYTPQLLTLAVVLLWIMGTLSTVIERCLGLTLLVLLSVSTLAYDLRWDIDSFEPLRKSVIVAREIIPPSAVVGSWDAGFNAYWLQPRTTINLDGMANSRKYLEQVLSKGEIGRYLQRENVSYLLNMYHPSKSGDRPLEETFFQDPGITRGLYDVLMDVPFERQKFRIMLVRFDGSRQDPESSTASH